MLDGLLAVARTVHYASEVQLEGCLLFRALIAGPSFPEASLPGSFARRSAGLTWISLVVAVFSGALWLLVEAAIMSGQSLPQAIDGAVLGTVLTRTRFGQVMIVEAALATLAAILLLIRHRLPLSRAPALAALPAIAMLATLSGLGHAAAGSSDGGFLHLGADAVHLVAAGTWLGGLVPLTLLLAATTGIKSPRTKLVVLRDATRRFSVMGIVAVGALLITGGVNTWYLAGTAPALLGTLYGRLLLVKILLFLAMVGIAAINRQELTPRLSGSSARAAAAAVRMLQRNAVIEAVLGAIVLAVVGSLGTMVPGNHEAALWPLPFRFSLARLASADNRAMAILAAASIWLGILVAGGSIVLSRSRVGITAAAAALGIFSVPVIGLITVKAYPTTFAQSPEPYTTDTILAGQLYFAATCSGCHGTRGRGDGPDAAGLAIKPADLTAAHLDDHSDGDLFWWISEGIAGTPMTGAAATLDEPARWNVIAFVRANADGARLGVSADGIDAKPARAPDFPIDCGDYLAPTLASLRGTTVHLVFATTEILERFHRLVATDSTLGVRTVIVGDPGGTRHPPACAATDPGIVAAYDLYRTPDAPTIAGTEFLIDRAGWIRAARSAGGTANWSDPETLQSEIALISEPVAAAPGLGFHLHRH